MSGFANPIIGGGGALVYPSIHSPNFSKGPPIVGWSLDKNGNLFLSGTLNGNAWVLNSFGIFFYSSTPAAGNLTASIASAAGNDAAWTTGAGNNYNRGIISYDPGLFLAGVDLGAIGIRSLNASTTIIAGAGMVLVDALTNAAQPGLQLVSPGTTAGSRPNLVLFGESADGTTAVSQVLITLSSSITPATKALLEVQGTAAVSSLDVAPALTAPPAAPAGVEAWNAMSLINGWANDAAGPNASYRLIGSPPRCVQLTGFLDSSAATSSQIANAIPAAYRPTVTKRFKPVLVAGALPAAEMFGSINSAGVISLFNIPTAAGDKVQIPEGTIYALDI